MAGGHVYDHELALNLISELLQPIMGTSRGQGLTLTEQSHCRHALMVSFILKKHKQTEKKTVLLCILMC